MESITFNNLNWYQPAVAENNQYEANTFEASYQTCLSGTNDTSIQLDSFCDFSTQFNYISDVSTHSSLITDSSLQVNLINFELEKNPFEAAFETFLNKPKENPQLGGNRQAAARCRYRRRAQLEKSQSDLNQTLLANSQLQAMMDDLKNEKVHLQMILACHNCPLNTPF